MRSIGKSALCALLAGALAQAQDWATVRALRPDTPVLVETTSGERVEGRVAAISESALVIGPSGRDRSIPRDSIARVSRREPPRNGKLLVGLGIGIGAAVGVVGGVQGFAFSTTDAGRAGGIGLLIGAPVGGGLLGWRLAGKGKMREVYSTTSR